MPVLIACGVTFRGEWNYLRCPEDVRACWLGSCINQSMIRNEIVIYVKDYVIIVDTRENQAELIQQCVGEKKGMI
jgi:hypothetical protein